VTTTDSKPPGGASRQQPDREIQGHHKLAYAVHDTGPSNLPPVRLTVHAGAFFLQDYFTARDADALALELHAAARRARLAEVA
jgi:hypothetical protein